MPDRPWYFLTMFHFNAKHNKQIGLILFSVVSILSSIANLNIATFQDSSLAEPFLLVIVSGLLVIQIVKVKIQSSINLSELVCFLFSVYIILKNLLINTFDVSSISYLLFFIILYYGLITFFIINNILAYSFILLLPTGIILLTYLAFAIYHCNFQKETLTNFFFPNKSIFSILLASQIAFVLPLYLNYKNKIGSLKVVNCFFSIIISTSVLLIAFTQGRAGWLGLVVALSYIAYQYLPMLRKRIVLYPVLVAFLLLSAVLFSYKSDSSNGRLLIYKISAGMLKDNWLFGIGHGQFKVQYNQYQAKYFASHNIDSKEALLADNIFYAFNDLLQAVIENGIIIFMFLMAMIFLLLMQIKNTKINSNNKHLFTASVASLICILTGSLFSYPLQIFPIAVQAILCLSIINSLSQTRTKKINLFKTSSYILKLALVILNIFLIISFYFYFNYKTKSNEAIKLKRGGFKQKAIEAYKDLRSSQFMDDDALYSYAQELHYSNQLQQAKEVIDKAKKYYTSNEVYKLSAAIEKELRNYSQAEKDYKAAIYMVPNRMLSRKNLLEFYLERKDTVNAIYWSNSIINMPVKFPSQITKNIQQNTIEILLELSR